jgi:nucleoside-diphosphate-sugar epimerase
MRVLLTGGAGFLGKRLIQSLSDSGQTDVTCVVRKIPKVESRSHLKYVPGNLMSKADMIQATTNIDLVIHAAAGTKGGAADMFANSVIGTRNLLDACKANKVKRVLLVSSFSVFDTSSIATGSVVDEHTPLENDGVRKGTYAYTKTQQEQIFWKLCQDYGIESLVVRPGVIFGEGGVHMSPRVGISALGWFAKLGGGNTLPLTYVNNCADAIVTIALKGVAGQAYNIVDDDLPSCSKYLEQYRREVKKLKAFPMPKPVLKLAVKWLEGYAKRSNGQLPAVLNDHIVKSTYRPFRYTNSKLKLLGWTPKVPMNQALTQTFVDLKNS